MIIIHHHSIMVDGRILNGKYVYFATDEFPFFPRCHWGNVSKDFIQKGG